MPVRRSMNRHRRRARLMTFGRRVRAIVNEQVETKFATVAFAGPLVTGAPQFLSLAAFTSGTGVANRVGNAVRCKAIHARFQIANQSAAVYSTARVQIYKDKQGGVSTTAPQTALDLPPNTARFIIKSDKWLYLSPSGTGAGPAQKAVTWEYHHRFPGAGALIEYNGPGAANLVMGGMTLYADTDAPAGVLILNYSISLYFQDA